MDNNDTTNPTDSTPVDDYVPQQNYQDDLDTKDTKADPVMREVGEDITEELGIDDVEAFRQELNKTDMESLDPEFEDERFNQENFDTEVDDNTK